MSKFLPVKPPIGVSVFGSETRITGPIASKSCTKNDSYVPRLRYKFHVSTFSRSKVIAFSNFVAEFVIFHGEKHRDFRRKVSRKSQFPEIVVDCYEDTATLT